MSTPNALNSAGVAFPRFLSFRLFYTYVQVPIRVCARVPRFRDVALDGAPLPRFAVPAGTPRLGAVRGDVPLACPSARTFPSKATTATAAIATCPSTPTWPLRHTQCALRFETGGSTSLVRTNVSVLTTLSIFYAICMGNHRIIIAMCSTIRNWRVNLKLLDLGYAPYVLYGVKYIDLVPPTNHACI